MKPNLLKSILGMAALGAALHLGLFALLADEVPKLLPFQGRLTDASGNAVSNGVRLVLFRIYAEPAASSPVWAGELHRTTVNGGLVNVMLGSKTPLTGVDFNTQLYLEITVDKGDENQDKEQKTAKRRAKRIQPASEEVQYGPEGTTFNTSPPSSVPGGSILVVSYPSPVIVCSTAAVAFSGSGKRTGGDVWFQGGINTGTASIPTTTNDVNRASMGTP